MLKDLAIKTGHILRSNSPAILTAIGVTGTVSTAYLAGKASFRAAESIQNLPPSSTKKEKVKFVWSLYIPSGISGALTIACIIGATKIGYKRTAALTAAYSLSERAFNEYKDKVIETYGKNKEQKVRDDIAQDRVRESAPGREVILSGSGDVLCCELYTGRYFKSDMETLRKSQNDINAKLVREGEATLSDFYYLIKVPYTSFSSNMGWNVDKLMELEFSTVLTEDGRPCLAFDYKSIIPF